MNNTRKEALTDLAALLSFTAIIISGIALGFICVANYLLPSLGIDMHRSIKGFEVIVLLVGCCILGIFLIYISVIFWLIMSRYIFKPAVIWKVARIGPLLKFDIWLLKVIVGNEAP